MATLKFDEQKDVFIGVKLPIQNGQQGYFDSSLTTIDQVKTNIRNLLLTIKGERLMHPEFGTDINAILFEQDDGTLVDRLEESIVSAIEKWLPYISISKIQINNETDAINLHKQVYSIKLEFVLKQDPTIFESVTLTVAA